MKKIIKIFYCLHTLIAVCCAGDQHLSGAGYHPSAEVAHKYLQFAINCEPNNLLEHVIQSEELISNKIKALIFEKKFDDIYEIVTDFRKIVYGMPWPNDINKDEVEGIINKNHLNIIDYISDTCTSFIKTGQLDDAQRLANAYKPFDEKDGEYQFIKIHARARERIISLGKAAGALHCAFDEKAANEFKEEAYSIINLFSEEEPLREELYEIFSKEFEEIRKNSIQIASV